MKLINNNPNAYPEKRNINLFGDNWLKPMEDIFCFGNKVKHRLTGSGHNFFFKGFFFSFRDQRSPAHFFNSINLGRNPYVVTFETTLPRLGNKGRFWYRLGIKHLCKPSCKKLIALSQCTFDRQMEYLQEKFPDALEKIKVKTIVMHPPQELLIKDYSEKKLNEDTLVFTIVGSDFFRKGGREVLEVFDLLIPKFPQLKLNIISDLVYGDYASKTTREDYEDALKIIERHKNNIAHFNGLSNTEVLRILKESNVGLLPSWGDTYGYSVLEAQAAGCPVITTNLRAFPEINNSKIGWVIEMPLNGSKDGDIDTPEKRKYFHEVLKNKLESIVTQIVNGPAVLREKGELCIERIALEHSPEMYRKKLKEIYAEHFKELTL